MITRSLFFISLDSGQVKKVECKNTVNVRRAKHFWHVRVTLFFLPWKRNNELKCPIFLFDCKEALIFSIHFDNSFVNFYENQADGGRVDSCGRTDGRTGHT